MTTAVHSTRVFLAEDSALIRTRIEAMFEGSGICLVGQAATPAACIEAILAARPDVVVLDVQLEGGAGLDVLNAVHPVAPEVRFIVFSNNSGPAWRKRYMAAGAEQFLDKSTEFRQLTQAVAGQGAAAGDLSPPAMATHPVIA
jgi:DNA-binding NarL/FixJ family response regulator